MKYIEFLKLYELDLEMPGDDEEEKKEPAEDPIKVLQDAERKKEQKKDDAVEKVLNKTEQKIAKLLEKHPDLINKKLYNNINKALETGDSILVRTSKQKLMVMQTKASTSEIEVLSKIVELLDVVDTTNTTK